MTRTLLVATLVLAASTARAQDASDRSDVLCAQRLAAHALLPIVEDLLAPARVRSDPDDRCLVVVDGDPARVEEARRLVARLDRRQPEPRAADRVDVLPLDRLQASRIAVVIREVVGPGVRVLADEPTNSIVLGGATDAVVARARDLIERLEARVR